MRLRLVAGLILRQDLIATVAGNGDGAAAVSTDGDGLAVKGDLFEARPAFFINCREGDGFLRLDGIRSRGLEFADDRRNSVDVRNGDGLPGGISIPVSSRDLVRAVLVRLERPAAGAGGEGRAVDGDRRQIPLRVRPGR